MYLAGNFLIIIQLQLRDKVILMIHLGFEFCYLLNGRLQFFQM